jgi:hypothetical protein
MNITLKKLQGALKRKDAPFFTGELNLNLIGVRAADRHANTFNDVLCVVYDLDGKTVLDQYPITTDPGVYYRHNPINVLGTAVLKPGHYRRCWQIGAHRGQYMALVQRGPMTVYRDGNKDRKIDVDAPTETGYFGINLHRASVNGYTMAVDKWSAGCQVFANAAHFNEVMALARRSVAKYGNAFSYTLLDEEDLS